MPLSDANDLHVYDLVARNWTDLSSSASGEAPPVSEGGKIASAGGKIYVQSDTTQYAGLHSKDRTQTQWQPELISQRLALGRAKQWTIHDLVN
jgi:hypothetical protein